MKYPLLLRRLDRLDATARAHIAAAIAADPLSTVESIAADCGVFAVLELRPGGGLARVGTLALRVDRYRSGAELVIVAAGGRALGRSLTVDVLPALDDVARAEGCGSIRLHTARPGFGRLLPPLGWRQAETVWRRELADIEAVA